jgi:hypothetical protein
MHRTEYDDAHADNPIRLHLEDSAEQTVPLRQPERARTTPHERTRTFRRSLDVAEEPRRSVQTAP